MTLKDAKQRIKDAYKRLKGALKWSYIKVRLVTLNERWTLGTQGGRKGDGIRKNGYGTVTVTVTAQKRNTHHYKIIDIIL
jgi:hypothetical protein